MDAVTIPTHELALYIAMPIVSSVVICCCICYCYQNRKLCFVKDHEDTLLIATDKKRFTIDLSQKRRKSNQSSDNETSSPSSPTRECHSEPELFVENPIVQPTMAHYAPIGQSCSSGYSTGKRRLQRYETEGKYDRRPSVTVNGMLASENNLTLNLQSIDQDMSLQSNIPSDRLTPSGLSLSGKLTPIEEKPGSFSAYSPIHRTSADSNMSDGLMINPPPASGRRRSSMQSPIFLNDINPRLYKLQASKMSSIGSDPDDDLPMLHFSLNYNTELEVLKVKIIQARNLQNQDFSGTNDPYCTVALAPGSNPRKSRVHRRTSDPEFEESFSFSVASDVLKEKTLQVKTYDFDQFSRDECIGIMEIKLKEIDFIMTSHIDLWRHINSLPPNKTRGNDKAVAGKHGDLMISLSYLKSAEKLTVAIQKARNLKDARMGIPDPYVKVCLYKGRQRIKKKKTSINHSESHPVFNQALIFNVPLEVIQACDASMICFLVHDLKFGVNEYLGQLELGPDVEDANDRAHWNEMLAQTSNKPVARWHCLKPPPDVDSLDPSDQNSAPRERRTSLGVIKLGKLKHLTTASSPTLRRSIT